ncbi:IS66 family transposase zinc-finger binding domain-containing protein [Bradyrhizobium neotropicale]|uniref:IS66 family transposase zinc-finger binding domain-containing protein n=1 Tax=Bradyrhizobium neotropicale TaxID=1497615 RepID=UPI001FF065E5|nr:IS66 family transposase zinc-finger binding domain-containing protein [Bradyrhizobium neotropicale]
MAKIGEDVSKRLDVIPAQWRVLVTRRPKYVCRRCSGAVVQAHAREHVVPGGLPTEAAIAHVIVSKFGERPYAVLPSGRDLCVTRDPARSGNAGQLVRPRLLPSPARRGSHPPPSGRGGSSVHG